MSVPTLTDSDYLYAFSEGQIYFHDPSESGWQAATVPPVTTVRSLAADASNPMVAYAGCDHPSTFGATGGLYRTIDG